MKSHTEDRSSKRDKSTEKSGDLFGGILRMPAPIDRDAVLPGSLNDCHVIRALLVEAIKKSGKSRAAIADEMSYLVGREITERQLNGFTAESKEDYRFPAELERAFCVATGDTRLLTCRVELAGLNVISDDDMLLLELGKQHHRRTEAEQAIEALQHKLQGRRA